jgi:hypothetical protein
MVHVPTATMVTVVPLTVHLVTSTDENVTAKPELAVAEIVNGGSFVLLVDSASKVMVCDVPVEILSR